MLKKLKASMGAGGATVETDLIDTTAAPGEVIRGVVTVTGGEVEQDVKYIAVGLQAIVEVEDDEEREARESFAGDALTGPFKVFPGFRQEWRFDMRLPWETPFNALDGTPLPGVRLGIETELEVASGVDKGDLDPIRVTALPSHVAVCRAVEGLGFRLKSSDIERGQIKGAVFPFHQEIEYAPGAQYGSKLEELEVTFVTGEHWMQVWFEADKHKGGDDMGGFRMPTSGEGYDVGAAVRKAVDQLADRP